MADSGIASMTTRSEAVFAVTVAVFACSTVFVFFRILSRVWIVRRVSLDDYFMLLAWVLAFGLSTSICYGATVGLGRHELNVPDYWQAPLKESQYAFSVLYNPALMAQKTSILVFYLSLSKTDRTFRWATIATLCVVNAAGLALTLVTIFQCHPLPAAFMTAVPSGARCTEVVTIYLCSAPVNIITDLVILFLPMPILTSMRLPKKQRLILVITFGFGVFVAAVDVVRIAYLQNAFSYRLNQLNLGYANRQGSMDSTDFSWYASFSYMWSAIEVNVGCMCACVPGLKPLVSRFLPNLVRDDSVDSNRSQSDHMTSMVAEQRVPSIQEAELQTQIQTKDFSPIEPAEDPALNMLDFLTTPGMNEGEMHNRLGRTNTALTNTSRDTRAGTLEFFDFVPLKRQRNMLRMSNRESVFPVAMVTVLFFIWGFEYGLLDVLNQQFQAIAYESSGQAVGIHSAYFAGYFVGPLIFGRLILKHWNFKACFSVGLAIYACGTLIFWPAAVLTSYPTFVVVNFIVGLGLSILEVAANPFITLCGPPQYAEIRLNLCQGFQAIGTVVAPLIAAKSFARYTNDAPSLIKTQWAYLGISLFTVVLAAAYYYLSLPDATDTQLEDASKHLHRTNYAVVGKIPIIYLILGFGVLSQFCYVGAQETLATSFNSYLHIVKPSLDASDFMAVAHTAFAVSRFLAAGAGFFIEPRVLLLFFYMGSIAFSAAAMSTTGDTAVVMMVMAFFFEGPLFSLVFAQSLRGMGRHTKMASVLITSAIGGGGVFPAISYAVSRNRGIPYSLCIAVAAFAGGTVFAIVLNGNPLARKVVDPITKVAGDGQGQELSERGGSSDSRASKVLSFLDLTKRKSSQIKDGAAEWTKRSGSDARSS